MLFLIYINDFCNSAKSLDFHLFADDSNLFLANKNLHILETSLNKYLYDINQWLCANKLSFNVEKSNFVVFHPPQKKVNFPMELKLNQKSIKQEISFKYLGVMMDWSLSWKDHVHQVSKKISRSIGILLKLRHFVDTRILVNIYYSIIYPFLTYGVMIWGNTYTSTIKPLITLQKKAIRVISFSNYLAHTSPFSLN